MTTTLTDLAPLRQGRLPAAAAERVLVHASHAERAAQVFGLRLGDGAQYVAALRADVAAGRVTAVDATVDLVMQGLQVGYAAREAPGLRWSAGTFRLPLPGRWRLYALPTAALVVGAEAHHGHAHDPGAPSPADAAAYASALLARQGYSTDDLRELAAGRVPARAAQRAGSGAIPSLAGGAVFVIAGALFGAVAIVAPIAAPIVLSGYALRWDLPAGLVVFVVGLVQLARGAWRSVDRSVTSVSGPVSANPMAAGPGATWELYVGDRRFRSGRDPLAKELGPHLAPGYAHRAYCVGGGLVAIEAL